MQGRVRSKINKNLLLFGSEYQLRRKVCLNGWIHSILRVKYRVYTKVFEPRVCFHKWTWDWLSERWSRTCWIPERLGCWHHWFPRVIYKSHTALSSRVKFLCARIRQKFPLRPSCMSQSSSGSAAFHNRRMLGQLLQSFRLPLWSWYIH